MSLIIDALKRAQKTKLERKLREQSFTTSIPWLSRWRKKWIISGKLLLPLGLTIAVVLLLTLYKAGSYKGPAPDSQSTSGRMATLPISRHPIEELEEEITEVALEEVPLRLPPSPRFSEGEAVGKVKKAPKKVAKAIPESVPQPAKSERPLPDKSIDRQISIQPLPSQEAVNHFNLGLLYHKNNKLHKALEEYKKALDLDPLNARVHNNLGMVYKELGRLPEAINQYQKAIAVNSGYEKAHHNLAVTYYLHRDYEKAIQEFELAIDCNPKNPETYNNLGLIYRKQKNLYRAKKMFEKGLAIAPGYASIHYNLALTLEDEGDWKGAAFHFRKFLHLAPDRQIELVQKVKKHLEILTSYERR